MSAREVLFESFYHKIFHLTTSIYDFRYMHSTRDLYGSIFSSQARSGFLVLNIKPWPYRVFGLNNKPGPVINFCLSQVQPEISVWISKSGYISWTYHYEYLPECLKPAEDDFNFFRPIYLLELKLKIYPFVYIVLNHSIQKMTMMKILLENCICPWEIELENWHLIHIVFLYLIKYKTMQWS